MLRQSNRHPRADGSVDGHARLTSCRPRQAAGLPHHDHPGGVVKPGVWDGYPETLWRVHAGWQGRSGGQDAAGTGQFGRGEGRRRVR